jgi:hypothetical protein
MPYIKPERRPYVFSSNPYRIPINSGELNYAITCIAVEYLRVHGMSYNTINEIVGALECAKQEFYRRVAIPYEDKKIEENGDVY